MSAVLVIEPPRRISLPRLVVSPALRLSNLAFAAVVGLVLVAGLKAPVAIMTSLVIQIAGMASGGVATIRQEKTDIRLALVLAAS